MQTISQPPSRADGSAGNVSSLSVWALVVFAAITPMILLIAPAISGQLGAQLHLTPSQIGNYFFVELGAFSLASVPSLWWMHRFNIRRVAAVAVAIFIVGNLATAWLVPGYAQLLWLRAITGLAGGTLMVICMTSAAQSTNHDRIYGLWVIGQLVVGAVGLFVLPPLFVDAGLSAFYYLLAGLALVATPLVAHFPSIAHKAVRSQSTTGGAGAWYAIAAVAILAVLGYYMAIGAVWTFAGSVASRAGLQATETGTALAVASLFGIAGAALAAYLGGRVARGRMLLIGYLLLIGSVFALYAQPSSMGYAVAISVFKFGWTFVLPFILAAVTQVDRHDKLVASLTLVIGAGLAFGPMVGGHMIEISGGLQTMLFSAAVVTLLSMAALLWLCRRAPR